MYTILFAFVLIGAPAGAAAEVTAARLDGTTLVGELRSWDDKHVVIATGEGEEQLATDQLISLRWSPTPAEHGGFKSAVVELTDGTLLPVDGFRSTAAKATVTLAGPMSEEKTLSLSRRQLAAVRLRPLESSAAAQWDGIRDAEVVSDVLVVSKRDGKSLDYVEGVLGDVSDERIEFKLDGESVHIDRAKVAGFIYYRADREPDAESRCILHGRSGLRASVRRATLADGVIQLATVAGAELRWPLEDIHLADFSAGKLVYLSDLEPASERWTPLVALPAGATLAAEYGRPRRDQSAYGEPLSLASGDPLATSPLEPPRQFTKGLALRSRTELVYRVPAGFRRFTAIAGIDPATSSSGNVRLVIYGDDRPLLETDIAGNEPPRPIELDIAGVRRLKIVVDYGQNLDTGDWLNLCDARIVK